ncbi:MAG TPA: exo-alpha-sialidase [Clostridia bacterium]|nr:exo-alpha-sialidase [Clostridia bacterium]
MITNQTPQRVRRMLTPRSAVLYQPSPPEWTYSHHASLCVFQGTMHAIWSNCEVNEDDRFQRVLHAATRDRVHWTKPDVLFESADNGGVWTAAGMLATADRLVAYAGYYEYKPAPGEANVYTLDHQNTTLCLRSTHDGAQWSSIQDLSLPVVPNHGPQALASGKWMISGNIVFPTTMDPEGLSGWTPHGLPPFPWQGWFDDSEGFWKHYQDIGDPQWLCEGSFFQMDDGSLRMLLRSRERRLFLSQSNDDGETWSAPVPTDFTDCGSKFHCGRLPDGRYYIVSNPDPASNRCPLVLSLSEDGNVFDREYVIDGTYRAMRNPGRWKGGIYGYPHTLVDNGHMFVICSINKEDVFVYDFPLKQLD